MEAVEQIEEFLGSGIFFNFLFDVRDGVIYIFRPAFHECKMTM